MRASEIYESKNEANVPWIARETLPPALTIPGMDPYYEYYRFLISLAGFPGKDVPVQSETRDVPFIIPFSKQEHDATVDILKKLGKNPRYLTKKPSTEPDETYTKSPVRKFEDLK